MKETCSSNVGCGHNESDTENVINMLNSLPLYMTCIETWGHLFLSTNRFRLSRFHNWHHNLKIDRFIDDDGDDDDMLGMQVNFWYYDAGSREVHVFQIHDIRIEMNLIKWLSIYICLLTIDNGRQNTLGILVVRLILPLSLVEGVLVSQNTITYISSPFPMYS